MQIVKYLRSANIRAGSMSAGRSFRKWTHSPFPFYTGGALTTTCCSFPFLGLIHTLLFLYKSVLWTVFAT